MLTINGEFEALHIQHADRFEYTIGTSDTFQCENTHDYERIVLYNDYVYNVLLSFLLPLLKKTPQHGGCLEVDLLPLWI